MTTQPILSTAFHGTPVHILDHAGQRWITAEEAGRCLGYSQANARQGVNNLYNRHADEFSEADTCVINLMTQGQHRELRIFSSSGCVLLSMFANTARAKDFRAWAKQVLAGHLPAALPSAAAGVEARMERLETNVEKMAHYLAALVQVSHQQAQKLDVTARYIGLLEINQKGKVKVTRTIEAQVLALKAQGMAQIDIARHLRISPASVSLLLSGKYNWSAQEAVPSPTSVEAYLEHLIAQERAALLGVPTDQSPESL